MTRKTATLLVLLLTLAQTAYCQVPKQPKLLKVKGTYVHSPTMTEFPENFGFYQRQSVYTFDKKKEHIGSTYSTEKATLSVYVYPAGDGNEGRLRNHYMQELQEMANVTKNGIDAHQQYKSFKKDGYRINGFSAITEVEPKSQFTLFECGEFFFKIRIMTNALDTTEIAELEREVLNAFDPTRLVKRSRLNAKATVYFAKAAFRDSLMLGLAMASAFKKVSWALENVDSLERAAGFPDLYLGLHVAALKELIQFSKKERWNRQESTTEYLDDLNLIMKAGFLEEFIMDQFAMVMIVPKQTILDFEGFQKWQKIHSTTINLNHRFYAISYTVAE